MGAARGRKYATITLKLKPFSVTKNESEVLLYLSVSQVACCSPPQCSIILGFYPPFPLTTQDQGRLWLHSNLHEGFYVIMLELD